MFLVIAGHLVVYAVFVGIGRLVRNLGGASHLARLSDFWPGWAASLIILQAWHLFLPIDAFTSAFLAALGLAGWISSARRAPREPVPWPGILVLIGASSLVSLLSLGPTSNGDSAVYHYGAVAWASHQAILPGLANLNPLLGLQSSHYLFMAALRVGPFVDLFHHIGNGVLLVALATQCLNGLMRLVATRGNDRFSVFSVLLFPIVVDQSLSHDLVSASADLSVAVMGAAAMLAFCALFLEPQEKSRAAAEQVLLLAAAGITLKLSFLALGGLITFLTLLMHHSSGRRRTFVVAALLAALGPGIWGMRSVLLSGYPGFPSTLLGMPVDWRLPSMDANLVAEYVIAWGRSAGGPPKNLIEGWDWFAPWLRYTLQINRQFVVPLSIAALAILITAVRWLRAPHSRTGQRVLLLVPLVGSFIFWISTAPDLRFAGSTIWLIAAVSTFLALDAGTLKEPGAHVALCAYLAVALFPLFGLQIPPQSLNGSAISGIPIAKTVTAMTDGGALVEYPTDGLCWGNLRCTQFPSQGLEDHQSLGYRIQNGRVFADHECPGQTRHSLCGAWKPRPGTNLNP